MPSWRGNGHNHIIWDYIDHHTIKYRTDEASSSSNISGKKRAGSELEEVKETVRDLSTKVATLLEAQEASSWRLWPRSRGVWVS